MITGIITLIFTVLYSCFILWSRKKWLRMEQTSRTFNDKIIRVGIVVPVRNEEKNLPKLLSALISQNYPKDKFSIIISDDHSQDKSIFVAEEIFKSYGFENFKVIKNRLHSKKNALTSGISVSDAELIITVDADVTMKENWIGSIVSEYVSQKPLLICGPVKLKTDKRIIGKLQQAEFAGLTVMSAAGISAHMPLFCNGANLAFPKKIFDEVNGYDGSKNFSGDDTQLMLKIHKLYPDKIIFLKNDDAIVETQTEQLSGLVSQRRRWASKIPATLSPFTILIAVLSWFVHLFLFIQFFSVWFTGGILLLFLSLSIKIFSEVVLLKSTEKFFDIRIPVWLVITVQPLYCLYITTIGLLSQFTKYKWKGRRG